MVPPITRPRAFVMLGVVLAPLGHQSDDDTVVPFGTIFICFHLFSDETSGFIRFFTRSLQMSPDFSGCPFYPGGHGHMNYDEESTHWLSKADIPALEMVIGGGMVETFAFGSDTPYDKSGQSGGALKRE